MAIITPTIWQTWANTTVSGGALTSLSALCLQIDKAIKNKLKRTIEEATYEGLIYDAPWGTDIPLYRFSPITIEGFECRLNLMANGDPDQFGDETIQTLYTDYTLDRYPDNPLLSPGRLQNLKGPWGQNYYRPPYYLGTRKVPTPGAIMLSFTGGYPTDEIPDDLVLAACLTISALRQSTKYGVQPNSESWNGYSYSLNAINKALNSEPIAGYLDPYRNYVDMIG